MMKEYIDLYGCKRDDIDLVKDHLDDVLGIKMEERESSYIGRYFLYSYNDDEEIECRENRDPYDGDFYEDGFQSYPILIYIGFTTRPEEFEKKLKASDIQFDLLEREERRKPQGQV